MKYTEPELAVLKKYHVIDENGAPVQVNLERPEGNPLGPGPMLDPVVAEKLVKSDSSPDKKWLNWIFYEAAGGDKGKESTERTMENVRERFMAECLNGFQDSRTKQYVAPVSQAEAEARWKRAKPQFDAMLEIGDQDMVEKLGTFGFYRSWPGHQRRYERVVSAVTEYLKLYPKLLQMNKDMLREGRDTLPVEPEGIKTLDQMDQINKKVERYFASKAARDDIRVKKIYEDDFITALAPLTYAAAVKYGFDEWAWANRARFDEVLQTEQSYNDAWKSNTSRGNIYVYLTLHGPVPSWISRRGQDFKRRELTNMALELNANSLKSITPDDLVVWDEENRNTMRLRDVKAMISAEPTRAPDPQDEEIPIKRGANVYKSKEQADEVIWHLDKAVEAVVAWAATFNPKEIKSDAMTLSKK